MNSPLGAKLNDAHLVARGNRLLAEVGLPSTLNEVADFTVSYFICVLEALFQARIADITRFPATIDHHRENTQKLLSCLQNDILGISLDHISADALLSGERKTIEDLVEIFEILQVKARDSSSAASSQPAPSTENTQLPSPIYGIEAPSPGHHNHTGFGEVTIEDIVEPSEDTRTGETENFHNYKPVREDRAPKEAATASPKHTEPTQIPPPAPKTTPLHSPAKKVHFDQSPPNEPQNTQLSQNRLQAAIKRLLATPKYASLIHRPPRHQSTGSAHTRSNIDSREPTDDTLEERRLNWFLDYHDARERLAHTAALIATPPRTVPKRTTRPSTTQRRHRSLSPVSTSSGRISERLPRHVWIKPVQQWAKAKMAASDTKSTTIEQRRGAQLAATEAAIRHRVLAKSLVDDFLAAKRRMELQESAKLRRRAANSVRERRQAKLRISRWASELERKERAAAARRAGREQKLFRQLFSSALRSEKEALFTELREARERRAEWQREFEREQEALEKWYADRYAMIAEAIAADRKESRVAEQEQARELRKLERELSERMYRDLEKLQEKLRSEEEAAFFRAISAEGELEASGLLKDLVERDRYLETW